MLKCVDFVLRERLALCRGYHISTAISRFLWPPSCFSLSDACAFGSIEMLEVIWVSSCTRVEDRSPWWSLTNFLRSDPDYYREQFSEALGVAAGRGDLEVVEWLLVHFEGCKVPSWVVLGAARGGHLRILRVLWEHEFGTQRNEEPRSCHNDNDSIVNKWCTAKLLDGYDGEGDPIKKAIENGEFTRCLNDGVRFGYGDRHIAIKHALNFGDFNLAERLLPPGRSILDFGDDCHHPEIIQRMFDSGRFCWNEEGAARAIQDLAGSGHLKLMQQIFLLHSPPQKERDSFWEDSWCAALKAACLSGNLSALQWLRASNDVYDEGELLPCAAEKGHVDVMQFLYEQNMVDVQNIIDAGELRVVFREGPLHSIKWITDHHFLSDQRTFHLAVKIALMCGRLEILQFLHSLTLKNHDATQHKRRKTSQRFVINPSSIIFEDGMFYWAVHSGSIAVLEWLQANYPGIECKENDIYTGVANGNLAVVQWLHVNRTERIPEQAMMLAASNGHFNIVKWLYANCPQCHTGEAIVQAIAYDRLQIANWLVPKFPNFKISYTEILAVYRGFTPQLGSLLLLRAMYPSMFTPEVWQSLKDNYSNNRWCRKSRIALRWISRNTPPPIARK